MNPVPLLVLAILASVTVPLNTSPASAAATGNLVAAYGFSEGTGTSVADASGGGNRGTVTNGAWSTAGRFGTALSFNGTSTLVTVPDSTALRLTDGMTLEAWIKPDNLTGWRTTIMKARPNGLSYVLYGMNNSKGPATYGHIADADHAASSGRDLPVDTWTHLAGTYDGTTLRTYVNGAQVAAKMVVGSLASSGSPLRIGGNAIWGEYFSGLIDEVRIYDRALAAAEIRSDMDAPVTAVEAGSPRRPG